MQTITLQDVNAALQPHYPGIEVVENKTEAGSTYFYIYSDDDELGLKIAGLYASSIYVSRIDIMTIEQWIEAVNLLFKNGGKRKRKTVFNSPAKCFKAVPVEGFEFKIYHVDGGTEVYVGTINEDDGTVDLVNQIRTRGGFADMSALINAVMKEYC